MSELTLIIQLFLFFYALFLSKQTTGNAVSMLSLFYFIWLMMVFLSNLNILNFYPIKDFVYYQLLISSLALLFGYYFSYILQFAAKSYLRTHNRYTSFNMCLNKSKLSPTIPSLIAISALLFGGYGIYYSAVAGINLQELRNTFFFSPNSDFLLPAQKITPILWVYDGMMLFYFLKLMYLSVFERKHRILFLFYCLSMIIFSFGTGGRTTVFDLFIYFTGLLVIIYTLRDKSESISKLFRSYLSGYMYAAIFFIFLISLITMFRGDNLTMSEMPKNLLNTFIIYIVGPLHAFSEFMCTYDMSDVRFGLSFLGLDTVIVSGFLRFVFGLDVPSILSQTSYMMQNGVNISNNTVTNAFYTYLFGIYVDAGSAGVFLFSFVAGMLMYYMMKSLLKSFTMYTFMIGITFIYAVFTSVRSVPTMSPSFIIFLVLLLIDYLSSRKFVFKMTQTSIAHIAGNRISE